MSRTTRLYQGFTDWKADGRTIDSLMGHIEYRNLKTGKPYRLKINPTEHSWYVPYYIWVLRISPIDYRLYDTQEQAETGEQLHKILN